MSEKELSRKSGSQVEAFHSYTNKFETKGQTHKVPLFFCNIWSWLSWLQKPKSVIWTSEHTHTHTHSRHRHTHTQTLRHSRHRHTHTDTQTHTQTHTHRHSRHRHTHTDTQTHTQTHTRARARARTHTHTHTHTDPQLTQLQMSWTICEIIRRKCLFFNSVPEWRTDPCCSGSDPVLKRAQELFPPVWRKLWILMTKERNERFDVNDELNPAEDQIITFLQELVSDTSRKLPLLLSTRGPVQVRDLESSSVREGLQLEPLRNTNCTKSSFSWSLKDSHRMKWAVKFDTYLSSAQLSSAQLSSAQLSSVQLSSVQFSSVQLSSVQLSSVQFSSVQLSSVQLSSVQLSSAQFSSAQLSFSSAQLSSAQLSSVQFSSVQFSSAQFSSAQLSSAQLSSVQLSSAQFSSLLIRIHVAPTVSLQARPRVARGSAPAAGASAGAAQRSCRIQMNESFQSQFQNLLSVTQHELLTSFTTCCC